jgi:hypothetical protein
MYLSVIEFHFNFMLNAQHTLYNFYSLPFIGMYFVDHKWSTLMNIHLYSAVDEVLKKCSNYFSNNVRNPHSRLSPLSFVL